MRLNWSWRWCTIRTDKATDRQVIRLLPAVDNVALPIFGLFTPSDSLARRGARRQGPHRLDCCHMDFGKLAQTLSNRQTKVTIDHLREIRSQLNDRTIPYSDFPDTDKSEYHVRIRANSVGLRQVLLHRVIALFDGSLQAAVDENAYVMILAIRGVLETAAALGYLHRRLKGLEAGTLEPLVVDKDVIQQLLGTNEQQYIPEAMEPKNILSMLEKADESISKNILRGSTKTHHMLRECYDYLCEYAHPNFHSHTLAFTTDEARRRKVYRQQGDRMPDLAFGTIGSLVIGSLLHIELHDKIDLVLPSSS